MTIRDIAVGLDGSDVSADALRWAAALAQATSAEIRALSTWQMPLVASLPSVVGGLPSQAFMANQCSESLAEALEAAGLDHEIPSEVRQGGSGEVLAAETAIADLVVVGRTGIGRRSGISRAAEVLLGSTARYVINNADGPVATVPGGRHWADDPSVVVGVDGSPASLAALAWAVENMPQSSPIHALRAIPSYLEGMLALDRGFMDRIEEATRIELDENIEAAVGHLGADAIDRVQRWVVVENARDALTEPGFEIDVIVVGERGRTGLAARLIGSVSDHVVRHASCPVIVVPGPKGAT